MDVASVKTQKVFTEHWGFPHQEWSNDLQRPAPWHGQGNVRFSSQSQKWSKNLKKAFPVHQWFSTEVTQPPGGHVAVSGGIIRDDNWGSVTAAET